MIYRIYHLFYVRRFCPILRVELPAALDKMPRASLNRFSLKLNLNQVRDNAHSHRSVGRMFANVPC